MNSIELPVKRTIVPDGERGFTETFSVTIDREAARKLVLLGLCSEDTPLPVKDGRWVVKPCSATVPASDIADRAITTFADDGSKVTAAIPVPPADDAAVGALVQAMTAYPDGPTWKGAAQRAVAAIRRGEVPHIVDASYLSDHSGLFAGMQDQIAALRAENARMSIECSEHEEKRSRLSAEFVATVVERDQFKARVAELERHLTGERDCSEQRRVERDQYCAELTEAKTALELADKEAQEARESLKKCGANAMLIESVPLASGVNHLGHELTRLKGELAALKGRKVKLPPLMPNEHSYTREGNIAVTYNGGVRACADAIRAAGIEVEG
jgi:hypothetical protein